MRELVRRDLHALGVVDWVRLLEPKKPTVVGVVAGASRVHVKCSTVSRMVIKFR